MSTESNFIIQYLTDILPENSRDSRLSEEYAKKLKELLKNPATVLTIFRCIDQYSQELVQRIARLCFHTSLEKQQEQILKRFLDENTPQSNFQQGRSDLARFKLFDPSQRGNTNGLITSYLDIITSGLNTKIDTCRIKKKVSSDQGANENSRAKRYWKKVCNQLMIMAQNPRNTQAGLIYDVYREILRSQGREGSSYQKYMEFILEDTNTQIDKILYQYCKLFSQKYKQTSLETTINFLLTLSNLDINKYYYKTYNNSTQPFQDWELQFLRDLEVFGMVQSQDKIKDQEIFSITQILWQFCYRKIDLKTLNAKITIETNFNVYAYINQEGSDQGDHGSDSTDHIEKLLDNFCDLHYKFPHLIVGQLSELKTKTQFRNGLTARLLIQFFNKTSDPQMKKYLKDKQMNAILLTQVQNLQKKKLEFLNLFKKTEENFSLIPDNIQQEIETWEREKDYDASNTGRRDGYDSDKDTAQP